MGCEFSTERVYGNISKLMRDQGIKVSEIETVMGVSAGYLSKLSKNQTVPNADLLYRIAQRLGVTVDMLITCDLMENRATDNLRLMTAYIQKLRRMTDSVELRWNQKTSNDLEFDNMLGDDKDATILRSIKDENSGKEEFLFYGNLSSRFRIEFAGESYVTDMDEYMLFMSKLSETIVDGEHAGEKIVYYELDAAVPKNTEFICSSRNTPELHAELELLYLSLQKHAADLQITESVREKIKIFVNSCPQQ